MPKKVWKSEKEKRRFMASPTGQRWLEKKMSEKRARRPDPGPPPERLTRTKFPFGATINGEEVFVWPDWIEYQDERMSTKGEPDGS